MSIRNILATTAFLSSALLSARADPVPQTPDTGITGQTCTITWEEDTTGNWAQTAIELMTGDNYAMVHLTTVTTLDSSKSSSYSWTCPEVTPNSAIYFYQFSAPGQDPTWTTRFALAGADGSTVPEPNATQPDGKAIPWGTGALVDPSTAVAAPSWLSSTSADSTTSAAAATSAVASSSSPAYTAASATPDSVASTSAPATSAAASSPATSAAASSSSGLVKVNTSSSSTSKAASSTASPSGSAAANQSSDNASGAESLRVPALVLSVVAGMFAYAL